MKTILSVILVSLFVVQSTVAWRSTQEVDSIDGKCLIGESDQYAVGESWYDAVACAKHTCTGGPTTFYEEVEGCSLPIINDLKGRCTIQVDKFLQYPDCCPQMQCVL